MMVPKPESRLPDTSFPYYHQPQQLNNTANRFPPLNQPQPQQQLQQLKQRQQQRHHMAGGDPSGVAAAMGGGLNMNSNHSISS